LTRKEQLWARLLKSPKYAWGKGTFLPKKKTQPEGEKEGTIVTGEDAGVKGPTMTCPVPRGRTGPPVGEKKENTAAPWNRGGGSNRPPPYKKIDTKKDCS